jgi:diaminopimelate decarboxylase
VVSVAEVSTGSEVFREKKTSISNQCKSEEDFDMKINLSHEFVS